MVVHSRIMCSDNFPIFKLRSILSQCGELKILKSDAERMRIGIDPLRTSDHPCQPCSPLLRTLRVLITSLAAKSCCKMYRFRRRLDTLKYFVKKMAEYPPHMQLKSLNLAVATPRELINEVIRIAVIDYKVLSEKLKKLPETPQERAHLEYLMAKQAIESVLANKYLNKLEEMMPDMAPGRLQRALCSRDVAIWRRYRFPIRKIKTFK